MKNITMRNLGLVLLMSGVGMSCGGEDGLRGVDVAAEQLG